MTARQKCYSIIDKMSESKLVLYVNFLEDMMKIKEQEKLRDE